MQPELKSMETQNSKNLVALSGRRCAVYARFSDREEGAYASTDSQVAACSEVILAEGGQLVDIYREDDRTGTNLNRKQWKRLLADAQAKRFEVVVVTFMSRLGRGKQFIIAEYELQKCKVQVRKIREEFDAKTLAGHAQEGATLLVDGMYPIMVREWTESHMRRMLEEGFYTGGGIPLGYKAIECTELAKPGRRTPKRIVPDPERRELAVRAFEEFAATNSIAAVRDLLAEETQERWDIKRTRSLLSSRTYIGEWRWGPRFVNPTAIKEPIVAPELFAQVQALLAGRTRGDKRANPRKNASVPLPHDDEVPFDYLFLGRVRCGCGGNMTPYWSRGRGAIRYYYYECYQHRVATCHIARISASTLQESVLSELVRMGKSPWRVRQLLAEARAKLPDAEGLVRDVVAMRRQDKQLAAQEDRLVESIATTASTAGRNALQRKLDQVAQSREDLRQSIEAVNQEIVHARSHTPTQEHLYGLLERFAEIYEAATPEEKRRIVRLMVQEVTVLNRSRVSVKIISDFVVARTRTDEGVSSTGSKNNAKRGDCERENLITAPWTTEFELPLKGGRASRPRI